ncbi:MAG: hypothetical protein IJL36_10125 [Clostridia bacterium]|nr:hypothetical protein [Clostridia bacterium]
MEANKIVCSNFVTPIMRLGLSSLQTADTFLPVTVLIIPDQAEIMGFFILPFHAAFSQTLMIVGSVFNINGPILIPDVSQWKSFSCEGFFICLSFILKGQCDTPGRLIDAAARVKIAFRDLCASERYAGAIYFKAPFSKLSSCIIQLSINPDPFVTIFIHTFGCMFLRLCRRNGQYQ